MLIVKNWYLNNRLTRSDRLWKKSIFRIVGEFEYQESVILMWPLTKCATRTDEYYSDAVSIEIVKNLLEYVDVIISCYYKNQRRNKYITIKLIWRWNSL